MIDLESFVEAALQEAASAFERYRGMLPLVPGGYSRTLLRKNRDYELVAMLWAPGCTSPIHDHADSRCWVLVMDGTIDVTNFARLDEGGDVARLQPAQEQRLSKGARDQRLNWRELHRVGNSGEANAYTLQVYAPQLREYQVVDEATGLVRRVPGLYDTVVDL